jgi:glycosyltransferase involved in cell wall biosynthesis
MRILLLSRYGNLGASSRVRFYQYVSYLESQGTEIEIAPLLNDDYIRNLYAGRRASFLSVLSAYASRIRQLTRSRSFDLLWIEKELFPWLPALAESLLSRLDIPYVVDYDDAVFHRYDMHPNLLIRALLGKNIAAVMRRAAVVVAGNDYLAGYARQAGARRVEVLPSVVDIERYTVREKESTNFRIGWIGSPVTAPFVGLIRLALEDVSREVDAHLVLIGAGAQDPLPGMKKEMLPWEADSEVRNIQSFDVGIMPLPDAPFERGKCGYKLIQYMACGLPVIASPVGANTRIVDPGRTGFLSSSTREWTDALIALSKDPVLRSRLGRAGRQKVEQEYSLQVAAPRLLDILKAAALH